MFRSKTRTEQLQDQADSLACSAGTVTDQLREQVLPAVIQATENAIEWSQPRVEAAREWAKPRVERGIEVAAPRLESAVSGLAPRVDTARDKIVDDLIPKLAEAINAWAVASAAARDEAVSRGQGAAAVLSGDAVASPKGKKKRVLLVLGVLTAAGAAAMAVMKKAAPKDDPWTTPLADPDIAAFNGRHSAASRVSQAADTATPESEVIDVLGETGAPSPLEPVEDPSVAVDDATSPDAGDKDGKGATNKDGNHKNASHKSEADENPPA
jgi:hypothetical protein